MLKPLYHHVVLEVLEVEKKTASGIILTEKSNDQPAIGTVVAVGTGKLVDGKLIPLQVKEQDKVVYKKYATTEVKLDGKTYYIVSEDDILAIIA